MKLKPLITEKTVADAKNGKYTFKVDKNITKHGIKDLIEKAFGVHVVSVRTITIPGEKRKTVQGRKRVVKPGKKTVITLKDKETIDIFETKK